MAWVNQLDERQRKEVELARVYARDFHHGTNGHNSLMLIALMADMLDVMEEILLGPKKETPRED